MAEAADAVFLAVQFCKGLDDLETGSGGGVAEDPAEVAQIAPVEEDVGEDEDPSAELANAVAADACVDVTVAVYKYRVEDVADDVFGGIAVGVAFFEFFFEGGDAAFVALGLFSFGFELTVGGGVCLALFGGD